MNASRSLFFLLALTAASTAQAAPLSSQDPVYKAIAAADTAVFGASNRCDLDTFGSYFTDDLEFYHDQSGLSVGMADLIQKTKNNICGKMVRELVPGSLRVFPLPGYGALELGTHRFLHPGDPNDIGQADFLHVWQLKGGSWKISRIISYDH
jgi:ketosteroid isomerase-like protein